MFNFRNILKVKKNTEEGFTLIELLVAVAIFTPLILMIVASFLSLDTVRENIQNKEAIMNELEFTMNTIGKEIHFGSAFLNPTNNANNCDSGCSNILFTRRIRPDVPEQRVEYSFDATTGRLYRANQRTFNLCSQLGGSWGSGFSPKCLLPITSDKVKLTDMKFFIEEKQAGSPKRKSVVTLVLDGTIGEGKAEDAFHLSSTFAPRGNLDPDAVPPSDNSAPEIEITTPLKDPDDLIDVTTGDPNDDPIHLEGVASDNVGIDSITWRNEIVDYGDQSGINVNISGNAWDTDVNLVPGFLNKITVTAKDEAGNFAQDTIVVLYTAPIPVPNVGPLVYRCHQSSDNTFFISGAASYMHGSQLRVYSCTGMCTPDESDFKGHETKGYQFEWIFTPDNPNPGGYMSFRFKAETPYGISEFSDTENILMPAVNYCEDVYCGGGVRNDPNSIYCEAYCLPAGQSCSPGGGGGGGGGGGTDTDGDGDPDISDPDIDGDGIPNGSDPDPYHVFAIQPTVSSGRIDVTVDGSSGTFESSHTTITLDNDNGPGLASFSASSPAPSGLDQYPGMEYHFSPNSANVSGGSTDFWVMVPGNVPPDSVYRITIKAESGAIAGTVNVDLRVTDEEGGAT